MLGLPSRRELQGFGLLLGGVFLVIGLWPRVFGGESVRPWALGVGGVLAICGAVVPQALRHIYLAWMKVGHILGVINTSIILTVIYYALITPMAISMRLMGKDAMHRVPDPAATTYRVVRSPRHRYHMRDQF